MGYNAPPGADLDSRAPWYSDPGEPEEREFEWEDELPEDNDEEEPIMK